MDKKKIVEWLAKTNLRLSRGDSLKAKIVHPIERIVQIVIGGGIGLDLLHRYKASKFSFILLGVAILIMLVDKLSDVCIGYLDEKKGFWKIEQKYSSKQLNPFFKEMADNIKEIKKEIKNKQL